MDSLLSISFVLVVSAFVGAQIVRLPTTDKGRNALVGGLAIRIFGSLLYLFVMTSVYGYGDYLEYMKKGAEFVAATEVNGPESLLSLSAWFGESWWGTTFVERVTGLGILALGDSLVGLFLLFAVASYLGILCFGVAFSREFGWAGSTSYLKWIAFFPSLWFWPSSLGKDSLVLLGIGLATLGFVGKNGKTGLLPLAAGMGLIFSIRPQVASALIAALILAHWLGNLREFNLTRLVQGVVLIGAGMFLISMASGAMGFSFFSVDEMGLYLDEKATNLDRGGSALGAEQISVWLAPVNVLFRPFLWEASGVLMLIAALEVVGLWTLAYFRRREIAAFTRQYGGSRLFWLGITFTIAYAIALGLSVGNMGVIARQRIHIMPFLFMFFAGVESRQEVRRPSLVYPPQPRFRSAHARA